MVKLRSRLIRTPSRGGGNSNNANGQSRRRTDQQQQQQEDHNLATAAAPRRPLESLDDASASSSSSRSRSRSRSLSSLRRRTSSVITSPRGKRKPESRGITASIRRAKTAMFRMASSPMTSSGSSGGNNSNNSNNNNGNNSSMDSRHATVAGGGTTNNDGISSNVAAMAVEGMDASEGNHNANGIYSTPTFGTLSLPRVRAPSQEENVPPMALLSPNGGVSYYAHAAAMDNDRCKVAAASLTLVGDDSNAMDVDASIATNPAAAGRIVALETKPEMGKNILEWMQQDAPPELLPKLLSFVGSRKMAALGRVNRAWNETTKDESVWRVMCEDTHKWSNGDEVPQSWARHYRLNPIVPIDYDTVDAAFDAISSGPRRDTNENHVIHQYREQRETARILLHPGPYFLRRPIVANVVGDAQITIEAVGVNNTAAQDPEHGMIWRRNYHEDASSCDGDGMMEDDDEDIVAHESSGRRQHRNPLLPAAAYYNRTTQRLSMEAQRPSTPILRQMFGCGRRSSSSAALDTSLHSSRDPDDPAEESSQSMEQRAKFHRSCFSGPGRPTPLLCLESRRENEPVVRVRQGRVTLRGLKIVHYCEGTDIWNGNAAVQVQRAFGRNGRPLRVDPPSVPPTANMEDCDVASLSGRGVVVIDGAAARIIDCNVHDSAATGVYIGGPGSAASMERTDVVDNGTGNARSVRGGVARGHSGVYVEQGLATLRNCNVSGNTLTGISAVSTAQARLHIEGSDVRANRSDQMELPPADSGRSVNLNNVISSGGKGRPRSERLREMMMAALDSPRGARSDPSTPQSPL